MWRGLEDHRRHRRAGHDCQDPHAPGLACTRATAFPGAADGALPRRPDPQGKSGSATGLTIPRALRSREAVKLRRREAIRVDARFELDGHRVQWLEFGLTGRCPCDGEVISASHLGVHSWNFCEGDLDPSRSETNLELLNRRFPPLFLLMFFIRSIVCSIVPTLK